ncbi:MAG: winged helix-turn-helix transcriptional regulator [archaeon]|nr:winged helix-turn-helix transcriptional regulator [archaeon]
MEVEGKTTLVMALFVVAVFMLLASRFMLPTSVQVIIEGQSTYVKVVPSVYTALDCVIIAISSFLLGASAFYLLFVWFRMPEKERIEQEAEQKEAGLESALQVQNADTHDHIPTMDVQVPETSKAAPEDDRAGLLKVLKGNEKKVIESLMEYGEMNQADLSARTGIPKSTLSRILQDLEDRSLIFRYDYGMSKMVKLDAP